jgi:DNA polymerase-1
MYAPPQLRIDADFYAYRSCQMGEEDLDFGDEVIIVASNFPLVTRMFERQIQDLKDRYESDDVVLYFTGPSNFRKTVDPDYKGNRVKRKPAGYKRLLTYAFENYTCKRVDCLEADDLLGIDCHLSDENFVMVSPDKDMKTVACRLFNGEQEVQITLEAADHQFYIQCLTGDVVDGYKGIPGIGPKSAEKILAQDGDPWDLIVQAYEKAGMTEEDALRNARLARILRPGEFNFETNEPILWTPSASRDRGNNRTTVQVAADARPLATSK